ncbi:Lacal_2735 family protein [Aquimarina sp. 2201CG5-10]|uniref:Lacal_2735 family protein n=1 Tax=Aquimarina callyspongiae TaxID=3098150 RepID=UPI002AB58A8F|nr:Lacal_2735 family protein [Aquimarina sp. 2201CG5-10]MDY8134160.1 Lacal_2735 family protein [Aquimarina sp. 2201CG5-10]
MFNRLRKNKTKLQQLQERYCKLMKTAYDVALKDKGKSDLLHEEADLILSEIQKLQNQPSQTSSV